MATEVKFTEDKLIGGISVGENDKHIIGLDNAKKNQGIV
jgi:hypothetical protein